MTKEMPEEIDVGHAWFGGDVKKKSKYIRHDIHEKELAKWQGVQQGTADIVKQKDEAIDLLRSILNAIRFSKSRGVDHSRAIEQALQETVGV